MGGHVGWLEPAPRTSGRPAAKHDWAQLLKVMLALHRQLDDNRSALKQLPLHNSNCLQHPRLLPLAQMSAPAPVAAPSSSSSSAGDASAFDESLINAAHDSARIDQELYEAQADEIAGEVSKRPLIGALEPLATLQKEYEKSPKFIAKIRAAAQGAYPEYRRVRGDGSCFYRSYVFGVLEWMSNVLRDASASDAEKAHVAATAKIVAESMEFVMQFGYERFTMEDFFEYFNEQFTNVVTSPPTSDQLAETFCDEGISQYVVSYARYLTSAFFQAHSKEYAPFLPELKSPDSFKREIEATNSEAEHLQIVCLSSYLNVGVRVAYLDQSEGKENETLRTYDFPESATPKVHLLYRPGHYDILQAKK